MGEISRALGVPKSTVSRIKRELAPQVLAEQKAPMENAQLATIEPHRATPHKDISQLVADYLSESLKTLAAHAVHVRDPLWLQKQNADDIAALNAVIADRSIRILEAMAAAMPLDDLGTH